MSRLFCDINGKFYSLSLSILEDVLTMPRKKMTKRKSEAPSKSFSPATLSKVEKEFFIIPTKLVKNATKHLTVLQKKNNKLTKAVAKVSVLAEKLEKKLLDIKQSKKVVKRAVANALKKQHQTTVKQHAALAKEQQHLVATLSPLEVFHAKFNFLSKQLVQLDKEWTALQKNKSDSKKSKKSKASLTSKKATSKKVDKLHNATVTPIFAEQDNVSHEVEELLSEEASS